MATDKINNKDKLSLVKSLEENGCLKLSIIHSECPKLSHRGSLEISMVRWGGGGWGWGRGGLKRPMFLKESLRSQYGHFCGTKVDVHEVCTGADLG